MLSWYIWSWGRFFLLYLARIYLCSTRDVFLIRNCQGREVCVCLVLCTISVRMMSWYTVLRSFFRCTLQEYIYASGEMFSYFEKIAFACSFGYRKSQEYDVPVGKTIQLLTSFFKFAIRPLSAVFAFKFKYSCSFNWVETIGYGIPQPQPQPPRTRAAPPKLI